MKRLIRLVVAVATISAAMWTVGQITTRKFEGDTDPDDDEFRLMAFLGGREARSQATALRSVKASVRMGGLDLDLTGATLAVEGAHLAIEVMAGGVRVAVPVGWKVYVAQQVQHGGIEIDVTDPDSLPEDAPMLTIAADVRAGGILIEAA